MYTPTNTPVVLDSNGKRKFIKAAAKDLNVSRTHLYLVLTGRRESKALMARIEAFHPELLSDELAYTTTPNNQQKELV